MELQMELYRSTLCQVNRLRKVFICRKVWLIFWKSSVMSKTLVSEKLLRQHWFNFSSSMDSRQKWRPYYLLREKKRAVFLRGGCFLFLQHQSSNHSFFRQKSSTTLVIAGVADDSFSFYFYLFSFHCLSMEQLFYWRIIHSFSMEQQMVEKRERLSLLS